MYNIVPDLLKAYYVSISVALVAGIVVGIGIGYAWFEREYKASGRGTKPRSDDASDEERTYEDEVARRLLEECDL